MVLVPGVGDLEVGVALVLGAGVLETGDLGLEYFLLFW